ncbi:MAG: enoyl-CoA hydratase/isomerase family protein [Deltaproteobacteria bacterium]|nr:MAG: enoyl-CoA hydratase/isomerase family protein [Deltaproteobacteria bacterium]
MRGFRFETLQVDFDGFALSVVLNRPDARNALSPLMVRELSDLLRTASADPSVRLLLIRGAGGWFCAGADLKGVLGGGLDGVTMENIKAVNRSFGEMVSLLDSFPAVTVSVVEGGALGGGMGLCAVTDLTLAHTGAIFGLPETTLGIPPAQILPFIVRRIGEYEARRLSLLGERISAKEAAEIGLVTSLWETEGALQGMLEDVRRKVRKCAPGANRETKRLISAALEVPLENLLDEGAGTFARCLLEGEGKEGVRAFLEKRKPAWAEEEE